MSNYGWCFGIEEDDEGFRGAETREEALIEGAIHAQDCGCDYFHIAPAIRPKLEDLVDINGEDILEQIEERNFEDMPEDWRWLDQCKAEHVRELEAMLKGVVINWIEANGYGPNWFSVGETERIETADVKVPGETTEA